jgi:hypothetical protein
MLKMIAKKIGSGAGAYVEEYEVVGVEKTLRDEFAMAAIASAVAVGVHNNNFDGLANAAYRVADAMMKARAK